MVAVNAVIVAEAWEDCANEFLEFCKPKSKVQQLFIIFDSSRESSIK